MTDTRNTPENRTKPSKSFSEAKSNTDKHLVQAKTAYGLLPSSEKKVPLVTLNSQLGKVNNINGDTDYVDDFVDTEIKNPPIEHSPPNIKEIEESKKQLDESSKLMEEIKRIKETKIFQKFNHSFQITKCHSSNSIYKENSQKQEDAINYTQNNMLSLPKDDTQYINNKALVRCHGSTTI